MRFLRAALLAAAFATLIAAPFLARGAERAAPARAGRAPARLVIITPHNEQIRHEFGLAFERWWAQTHDGPTVTVDWRAPGGTSEIRKLLESQYIRAVRGGAIAPDGACDPGAMPYDILFGGGAYEHDVVKKGVSVELAATGPDGKPLRAAVPMSVPARLTDDELKEIFPENRIGQGVLHDPQKFWLGAALTAFGIGFNRDVIRELGVPEPSTWDDLTDRRYAGRLAMTDPRQSGSVATTYDSILNAYGWEKGWRVLRGMAANARFFANTSLKPPLEISSGEAAAGPVLEFYGRYQSQSLLKPGQKPEGSRLGYVDPPGMVFIDSDPISILRGGPNPEAALEFVRFALSEQGQALWQFKKHSGLALDTGYPVSDDALQYDWGPDKFELRRMPVRRSMYEKFRDRFVDRDLRPFEIVSKAPLMGWRPLVIPMFSAFAIDIHADMREAWDAMGRAAAAHADPSLLAELDAIFYAMPPHPLKDGATAPFAEANFKVIRDDWRDPRRETDLRMAYTAFFRERYREVTRRAREAGY